MAIEIYVGNLLYDTTKATLEKAFSGHPVGSIRLITDEATGRSKGFAFVELAEDAEAKKVIDALNGIEVDGRNIKVGESQPHRPRNNGRSFDEPRRGGRGRDRGSRY
ncbi:MAG: RNA recognition motif domain-containing protein [Candidatus Aquicultorales bacterium]